MADVFKVGPVRLPSLNFHYRDRIGVREHFAGAVVAAD